MNNKWLYIFICGIILLWGCQTAHNKKTLKQPAQKKPDKPVRKNRCRFQVQFNTGKICLDGKWYLSVSYLPENQPVTFQKSRGGFFLIPLLTTAQKKRYRKELNPNVLDTATVEKALALHGRVLPAGIVLEQHNPTVSWQENWRYSLTFRRDGFHGQLTVYKGSGTPRTYRVVLSRRPASIKRTQNRQLQDQDFSW